MIDHWQRAVRNLVAIKAAVQDRHELAELLRSGRVSEEAVKALTACLLDQTFLLRIAEQASLPQQAELIGRAINRLKRLIKSAEQRRTA